MKHYTNTNNPIDFPGAGKGAMRDAFEQITCSSFGHELSYPRNIHGRDAKGEYVNAVIEDHWQTFQEGWEAAIESLKKKNNPAYSDIISDGGKDPRK